MLRCFVAVDIDEPVSEKIRALQSLWRGFRAEVRFVDPASSHVTLKFLGPVQQSAVARVRENLSGCTGCGTFEFRVRRLGVFPKAGRPRVFWAGIDRQSALSKLHECVEGALAWMGATETRDFQPHVTVARAKGGKELERLLDYIRIEGADFDAGTVKVNRFHLYQSLPEPRGARYVRLASFSLA